MTSICKGNKCNSTGKKSIQALTVYKKESKIAALNSRASELKIQFFFNILRSGSFISLNRFGLFVE